MIPQEDLPKLKPFQDQTNRAKAVGKGHRSPERKKMKHHCSGGHIMKRDGDMFRCKGMINSKNKKKKVKHNVTKAWAKVEPIQINL